MRSFIGRSILVSLLLFPVALFGQSPEDRGEDGSELGGRERYLHGMRAYPFDRIPQNARLDAAEYAATAMRPFERKSGSSLLSAAGWRSIGPFDIAGRITSVAVHPTDGKTVWAGAADGGVWKSTDRGASWTPVMDYESSIAVGALAVDPGNGDVLYVATGEGAYNVDMYTGAGILKSTDGGTSWRPSGLGQVGAFTTIVVDPRDGRNVLAGGIKNNAGLYRSTDGGVTWSRRFDQPITDITLHPTNPGELWVATGRGEIYHSLDGGATLTASSTGLGVDASQRLRISLQVAPADPATLFALVYENNFQGASHTRIYVSTDGGASWGNVFNDAPNFLNLPNHPMGDYTNVLAVKPDNPDVVFAGGVELYTTTDGGGTWRRAGPDLHPDFHALEFDPTDPRRLYVGTDGGMYRSDDAGATFTRISKGLAITQFYAMAIDQSVPDLTYGGTQDNGTITNEAVDYNYGTHGFVAGGDGFFVAVDHATPNTLYFERPYGEVFTIDLSSRIIRNYSDGLDQSEGAAWSAPLLIDPTSSPVLYTGRTRVWKRRDGTTPWAPISPSLRGKITALAISSRSSSIIYAGTEQGDVRVTLNGGIVWRRGTIGLPDRAVTDFALSASHDSTAWVSLSGFYTSHVFKTTNAGASWTDVGTGLPDIPVNALAVHPQDEAIIYAGTDIGMFITTDGGVTWATYNEGFPRAAVVDLAIHESSGTLRAATHGRSMWEIPLERPAATPAIVAPAGGEQWIGGARRAVSWSGFGGAVRVEYSLDNGASWRELAPSVTGERILWSVPDTMSVEARIRVTSVAEPTRVATSLPFTILPGGPGGLLAAASQTFTSYGLAFDGTHLWVNSFYGDTLVKLDPVTLTEVAVIPMQLGERFFTDMAYSPHSGTLFIHRTESPNPDDTAKGWLYEVGTDGRLIRRLRSPAIYPTGLAWLDDGDDGVLVASEMGGDQNLYVIDPEDGATLRTIPRAEKILFGPNGMTTASDGASIWHVIDRFSFDRGPIGSSVVKLKPETGEVGCSLPLMVSRDSSLSIWPNVWGQIFAQSVERDPSDNNLWVSGIDGTIYKFASCEAISATAADQAHERSDARLATIRPNPFGSRTEIVFTLAAPGRVELTLYDNRGAAAARLADGFFPAGEHRIQFAPAALAAGVYRCVLEIDGQPVDSRGVVHLR